VRYRALGKTGLKVSELSFGCASLSQDYAGRKAPSRKDAIRLLRKAYDAGITFFDTAPSYGNSEEILGEAIGHTDAIFCTKYKSGVDGGFKDSVRRSIQRLGRTTIDVLLFHGIPPKEELDRQALELAKVNCIYASGFSPDDRVNWINNIRLIDNSELVFQLPYNIIWQTLLWLQKPKAIIARQPYARGLLCNPPWNIGEQALRFCLSNKHISTVLVGMQTEEELEMNLRWAELGPLPLEMP